MRYLGNKTRLLNYIEGFIIDNGIKGETFCDLFAGSASVADKFKDKYKIIANDFLYSSYIIAQAKLAYSHMPKFETFNDKFNIDIFEYFNNKTYQEKDIHFLLNNYSPKGNRMFFTEMVANKIDGIRLEIAELYMNSILNNTEYSFIIASLLESAMGVSNTTGTYEAYLKNWDNRALKPFVLKPLTMEYKNLNSDCNETYNEDANELIRKISGDILYLDTPYTNTEYSSAYHVLETIAKYNYPEIQGITGRKINNTQKSLYSKKKQALSVYEDLIRQAKFNHIIISYSNQGLIPLNELTKMVKRYSINNNIVIQQIPFREYKNINSSKKSENLYEVLIYIEKDHSIIKSPLNYSGSKNYIVDLIKPHLPINFSTFVDAMGGAFNIGININCSNKVIYNEYNSYIYGIIRMLLVEDKELLCRNIKNTVDKFKLQKGDKEAYNNFRDYYNKNKTNFNLFVLQMYSFQNQIRFNSNQQFNTPVGNSGYNDSIYERIVNFNNKYKNIELLNKSYIDIDLNLFDKDTVFYFDPPYSLTRATYNDGKRGFNGWDEKQELELLNYLIMLNNLGFKFILSNVIYHKEKTNHLLLEWINKNNFKRINIKTGKRNEVIIINY